MALKLDDFDLLLDVTFQLLLLLASLNCGEYVRCLVAQLNSLLCHRHHNTDVWKMYKSNVAAFNEEVGEMSFSILARCTLGDTQRHKFKHLCEMYSLIHVYRSVNNDILDDISGPLQEKKFSTGKFVVHADSIEVKTMEAFFSSQIREILAGRFRIYDGSKQAYNSKADGVQHMIEPVSVAQVLKFDSAKDRVHDAMIQVQNDINSYWLARYTEVWPEAKQQVVINSNDELMSTDEGSAVVHDLNETEEDDRLPAEGVQVDDGTDSADDVPLSALISQRNATASTQNVVLSKDQSSSEELEPCDPGSAESPPAAYEHKSDGGVMCIPQRIEGEKKIRGKRMVWMRWQGYDTDENTWEPIAYYEQYPQDYKLLLDDWAKRRDGWFRNRRRSGRAGIKRKRHKQR